MNKRLLISFIGMMISMIAWCITVPEAGKYYRIVNQNPDKASNVEGVSEPYAISEDKTTHALSTVAQDDDSKTRYAQIWYCASATETSASFMNARTRRYTGNASTSVQMTTGMTAVNATLTQKTKYFLIGTGGGMWHSDSSNRVVGWNDESNTSNHWCFVEVTVDSTTMLAVQASYQKEAAEKASLEAIAAKTSTYATLVQAYFNDYACTDMKSEYSSMTDDALKTKMAADGLPEEIQTVVLRIKNKWSDECDASQSAKFRVQEYPCYPRADEAKSYTKATQISDMNNITGIWTNSLQLLYIFVDSDIPENASLTIAQTTGDQGRAWYTQGTALKKGLNIVYCGTDLANNWIMYTVPFSTSKPIAEYPKIKIHIEGGNVIGYMNTLDENGNVLPEDECNALWKTQLQYANKVMKENGYTNLASDRIDFAVKGERGMMLFPIECYNQIWATSSYNGQYTTNYNIYKSMRFYDNVLKWEWGAMGITKRVVDGEAAPANSRENMEGGVDLQPTYVNNLAPGMMIWEGGKNPYSSDGYTSMPGVGAVESSYNAERASFDVWCVGHESGHNNQGTINLPCSMESSNNYFSNIIQYQNGYRLSRGMTFMENMDYVTSNTLFPHRSISMTLRMYFNLYLYYHRAKNNTQFSTKLHKLLRSDGMYFGGEGWWEGPAGGCNMGSASTSWLKFYEKACDAAGEDLTEYFRMWGFFIPTGETISSCYYNSTTKKWYAHCGDYSSYYISSTQAEIDAAIKRVKAKGYPENRQIMFIEDRLKPQKRFDAWDPNGTDWKKTTDGGDASNETTLKQWYGDLGYVDDYMAGSTTRIDAADYSFVADGTTITMTGNGGGVGVVVYNEDGSIGYLSNRLSFTIPESVALTNYTVKVMNADGTEVVAEDKTEGGKESQLSSVLQQAVDNTASITSMVDATGCKVGYYLPEAVATLNSLVAEAKADITAKKTSEYTDIYNRLSAETTNVKTNGAKVQLQDYGLYTIRNNSRGRYLTDDASTAASADSKNAKWSFIKSGSIYYMQNAGSLKLINSIYSVSATTLSAAQSVTVTDAGNGCWYLYTDNGSGSEKCLNNTPSGEKIIAWSEDSGSQWYITKVEDIDPVTSKEIQNLIDDTKTLMDKAGTIKTGYEKLTLQTTDKTAANYVATNKANSSYPIANLVDGDKSTDFYTKKETSSTTPHMFYVDLGAGNGASCIRLTVTTPTNGLAPKTIVATPGTSTLKYATDQATTWTDLPDGSTQTTKAYDTKEVDQEYRYWRFQVTEVNNSTAPQFGLAEIQLRKLSINVTLNSPYENLDKNLMLTTQTAYKTAESNVKVISTPLSNSLTYADLKDAYDALDAAMIATDIKSLDNEKSTVGKTGIFNVSGQRVDKITKGGIYIVNGKKVIVK